MECIIGKRIYLKIIRYYKKILKKTIALLLIRRPHANKMLLLHRKLLTKTGQSIITIWIGYVWEYKVNLRRKNIFSNKGLLPPSMFTEHTFTLFGDPFHNLSSFITFIWKYIFLQIWENWLESKYNLYVKKKWKYVLFLLIFH